MLGETKGTSAGGADEAGKFLRVPGTNPFFPLPHDLQGNRFLELMEEHPLDVYLMNTGRVGGPESDEGSKKVKIKHSSAIVKGVAEGTIEWESDPDFGYLVASSVPGIDAEDIDVLQPRRLYEAAGRAEDYRALAERFKSERVGVPEGLPEPLGRDRLSSPLDLPGTVAEDRHARAVARDARDRHLVAADHEVEVQVGAVDLVDVLRADE